MYSADPRYNASEPGILGRAYAKREVIISGGTFNSPQILKLSGIGPEEELKRFGIPVVVDLPGVGRTMQDNSCLAELYGYQSPLYLRIRGF